MNGPMAYGGYACAGSKPVPDALTAFPTVDDGEERILVVQRGPFDDPNEDYDGDGTRRTTMTRASRATRPRPRPRPAGTPC